MSLRLDERSAELLGGTTAGVLIGVIDRVEETVRLFVGQREIVHGAAYPGHRELIADAGDVASRGWLGFSIYLADGRIRAVYRASSLNLDCEDFCISTHLVDDLLRLFATPLAAEFRSYPT